MFISFEGIECAGKGVQARLLRKKIESRGLSAMPVREPGGTLYSEMLRAMIKHPAKLARVFETAFAEHEDFKSREIDWNEDLAGRTGLGEMLMFLAARSELVAKQIKPALAKGKIVIADRFIDSTTAYQGGGRFNGDPAKIRLIEQINKAVLEGTFPDVTFWLDIPIQEMLKRIKKNKSKDAFFERAFNAEKFERIRSQYQRIAAQNPRRVKVMDGTKPIYTIHREIMDILEPQLAQ